jgi:DNA-binding MarR family transcriptional regulator
MAAASIHTISRTLTAAGRRIVDETVTRHVANEERLLSALTTAEQEMLNALLRRLIVTLSR